MTASPVLKTKALNTSLFKLPAPSPDRAKKSAGCNKSLNKSVEVAAATAVAARRKEQLKELKQWENEMNSISKDPVKIVVENEVDKDGPPTDFKYINDYLPRNDIVFPDDPLIGCECAECDVKGCCPDTNDAKMAYSKYKRLRDYVSSAAPIFECNKHCK